MFYSTSSQLNQNHIDSYCEEVLLARKAEHIGIDEEVDMESILKMPEGATETRWYYCVIRYGWPSLLISVTFSAIASIWLPSSPTRAVGRVVRT